MPLRSPSGREASQQGPSRTRLLVLEIAMVATPVPPVSSTGPLSKELLEVADVWARSQHQLVVLAARFAASAEWVRTGSPTAAHWLATAADVEVCTAREWVRIGAKLLGLPAIAAAFAAGTISYSKVRALTRIATVENESELVGLALKVPAGDLRRVLAAWTTRTSDPDELAAHQRRQRSVRWRQEPDGMVTFWLRLPPWVAGTLIAWLTSWVMTRRRVLTRSELGASAEAFPSVVQQHADAIEALVDNDGTGADTEVVLHVRGDGCTLDDGTPIAGTYVEEIAPASFLRALVHDADGRPINASGRQRHPSTRQKRVVKERDRVCIDCGSTDLLEFDHNPAYETTGRTIVDELQLRCATCHRERHAA